MTDESKNIKVRCRVISNYGLYFISVCSGHLIHRPYCILNYYYKLRWVQTTARNEKSELLFCVLRFSTPSPSLSSVHSPLLYSSKSSHQTELELIDAWPGQLYISSISHSSLGSIDHYSLPLPNPTHTATHTLTVFSTLHCGHERQAPRMIGWLDLSSYLALSPFPLGSSSLYSRTSIRGISSCTQHYRKIHI